MDNLSTDFLLLFLLHLFSGHHPVTFVLWSLSSVSQLRYIPWSDSFTFCCFNFRPVIMPCFGSCGAYSRLVHPLVPKSWSATEESVTGELPLTLQKANICRSAKWQAGGESRGWLVPIMFHSLEVSGSNFSLDTGYSRWDVSWLPLLAQANAYDVVQAHNNTPSSNLKVIHSRCIYNTTRSII